MHKILRVHLQREHMPSGLSKAGLPADARVILARAEVHMCSFYLGLAARNLWSVRVQQIQFAAT